MYLSYTGFVNNEIRVGRLFARVNAFAMPKILLSSMVVMQEESLHTRLLLRLWK